MIEVVKHDHPVTGLAEKDATMITFGRTLLRENKVSSEVWAEMVGLFGRQGTIDFMSIMGDYTARRHHVERRRSAAAVDSRGLVAAARSRANVSPQSYRETRSRRALAYARGRLAHRT